METTRFQTQESEGLLSNHWTTLLPFRHLEVMQMTSMNGHDLIYEILENAKVTQEEPGPGKFVFFFFSVGIGTEGLRLF